MSIQFLDHDELSLIVGRCICTCGCVTPVGIVTFRIPNNWSDEECRDICRTRHPIGYTPSVCRIQSCI